MDFNVKQELLDQYTCEGCGQRVRVFNTLMTHGPQKGQWVKGEIGCDCELLKIIKRDQKEADKLRLDRIFSDNSIIPPKLKKACFETFLASTTDLEKALHTANEYVQDFEKGEPSNLFFQGTFGTGKSHLSISIAKALKEKGFSVIFISIPKLLTKLRSTFNNQSEHSEDQIIDTLCKADLVVFDDIGAEGEGTSWSLQKLFEIIDQRGGKHNIFTTNLSSDEFKISKDLERIFSRMMMDSEVIVMNGKNQRLNKFRKEG